jgi:hypothetical protein
MSGAGNEESTTEEEATRKGRSGEKKEVEGI